MKISIVSYSMRSKQVICIVGKPIWTYCTVPDDCKSNFLATDRDGIYGTGWPYGKLTESQETSTACWPNGWSACRSSWLSFVWARLCRQTCLLSQGVSNWRTCVFPLAAASTNISKFIDIRVLLLGFRMSELKELHPLHRRWARNDNVVTPEQGHKQLPKGAPNTA